MFFRVVAQIVHEDDKGWRSSQGAPTFILDGDIQGIVNLAHAEAIARRVVDPQGLATEVHVSVVEIGEALP